MNKQNLAKKLIILITIIAVAALFFVEPIKQDLSYHDFIDNKTQLGIAMELIELQSLYIRM